MKLLPKLLAATLPTTLLISGDGRKRRMPSIGSITD